MYKNAYIFCLTVFVFFFSGSSIAQLSNNEIHDLKSGRVTGDSSYIYWLPYESGKKFWLVQGWQSHFSHKGELSLDFKMKTGTQIFAAREGIVSAVKEDAVDGAAKSEYLGNGNHVVIAHSDGSFAGYWHLQHEGVLVNVGDTIRKGQLIGLSGNTGYSAFPHLHFWVFKNEDGFKTIPTRFATRKGARYLRPGQFYRSLHQ